MAGTTKYAQRVDAAWNTAMWWKQMQKTNVPTFLPLFFDEHRHLILKGGAGSGKSLFAGRKILERCVTEPGHRMLVVRKVAKTLRESCFHQLCTQALEYYPEDILKIPKGKNSDMYILFKNGSEMIFAGLDDVEKMKSIHNITGIWIEEASELEEEDFSQLDIRLRGETAYYQQIIVCFNPISALHWLKKRFFDYKDPKKRVRVHESTYMDNPFLPQKDRDTLESFKDIDPYYYMVYCLNQWGIVGNTIFNKEVIGQKLMNLVKPIEKGRFRYNYDELHITDIAWDKDRDGEILIYEKPQRGHPYVIGADTAGEGSDWFVAQVLDNSTGRLVAKYRVKTDEDLFARELFCLGKWYNTALIGVEANFSTHPLKELQRLGYDNLFLRQVEDSITHQFRMSLGFLTDSKTRPVIIAGLVQLMREHPELVDDEETLYEMLTFARNEKGRAEAIEGAHDDCVMALAIAHYIRSQQSYTVTEEAGTHKKADWTEDMLEDYWNAKSEDERRALIAAWGNPF